MQSSLILQKIKNILSTYQKPLILLTILCCCGSWNITMAFEGSHYNFLKIIYIQYTVVNKCRSQTQLINCGLPQGSILSPLLFSLYVNDLPKASNFKTTPFADDTCPILANKNIDILEKMVDQEIN